MKRITVPERQRWQERFEEMGFTFHSLDGLYWREGVCYEFTSAEVDYLEEVTATVHGMCLDAVEWVVRKDRFEQMGIPLPWRDVIRNSWKRGAPSLYGRFDFVYDGTGEARLLEYNADTPTSLFESSIAQWIWLEDLFPDFDQFNSIHEKLEAAFNRLKGSLPLLGGSMHFACVRDHEEDLLTVEYLRDVALQAGIDARHVFVEDIGWDAGEGAFLDLENHPITHLFKLYPWEWLLADEFGQHLLAEPFRLIIEPAWKLILSNKAILPVLWELFPGHPNLLPAAFAPLAGGARLVRKPFFSREGANVAVLDAGGETVLATDGAYGGEGFVYQEYRELPRFGDSYALIGSWVVDGQPAGLGIREDNSPITRNSSTFVPHFFKP